MNQNEMDRLRDEMWATYWYDYKNSLDEGSAPIKSNYYDGFNAAHKIMRERVERLEKEIEMLRFSYGKPIEEALRKDG